MNTPKYIRAALLACALALAASAVDASQPEPIRREVLDFSARVSVSSAAGEDSEGIVDCITAALARIPGVEFAADDPEWIVKVGYTRLQEKGIAGSAGVVSINVIRPFRGRKLMSTLVKPEYRDLAGRVLTDLHTVSEPRLYVVARKSARAGICRSIAMDFDRTELGKKRTLLQDVREGIDADDHNHP